MLENGCSEPKSQTEQAIRIGPPAQHLPPQPTYLSSSSQYGAFCLVEPSSSLLRVKPLLFPRSVSQSLLQWSAHSSDGEPLNQRRQILQSHDGNLSQPNDAKPRKLRRHHLPTDEAIAAKWRRPS